MTQAQTHLLKAIRETAERSGIVVTDTIGPVRQTEHENMLEFGRAAAMRSDCTRRWVGAVLFDIHGRVIGAGRNGAPPKKPGCLTDGACPRGRLSYDQVAGMSSYDTGPGTCIGLHAEQNGIMDADPVRRRGGTIAIVCLLPGGHELHPQQGPCEGCVRMIQGSGLARAIWPGGELLV